MATIRCHFDGQNFVPDEPVDLPVGQVAFAQVQRGGRSINGVFVFDPEVGDGTSKSVADIGIGDSWKDRTDIGDLSEFARKLRESVQTPRYQQDSIADDTSR